MYVSSAAVAHDLDSIVSHQITHVVNCAGNTVLNLHSRDGVKYAALPINDDGRTTTWQPVELFVL